mmetsp:Transcript_93493/g.165366  ORF Transcript_93493/g.165366 Transcript_93493/m.165366 type:complete len:154 (+) Transcript_93493:23-484(+)
MWCPPSKYITLLMITCTTSMDPCCNSVGDDVKVDCESWASESARHRCNILEFAVESACEREGKSSCSQLVESYKDGCSTNLFASDCAAKIANFASALPPKMSEFGSNCCFTTTTTTSTTITTTTITIDMIDVDWASSGKLAIMILFAVLGIGI